MKTKISLAGMEFYAHHGCFEEERIIGTRFLVDVSFFCDVTAAAENDDLTQTVDYQEVYSVVREEMNKPSRILEHVAYRIMTNLKSKFKSITNTEVTVSKLNPVLGGKTASASVTVTDTSD